EGRYLVHFLFRQEPLVRLHFILSTLNRLLASHLAVEEVRSRVYSLEIERNLPCIWDTVLPCRKLRSLSSQDKPVVIPVYHAFPRRRWRDSLYNSLVIACRINLDEPERKIPQFQRQNLALLREVSRLHESLPHPVA